MINIDKFKNVTALVIGASFKESAMVANAAAGIIVA